MCGGEEGGEGISTTMDTGMEGRDTKPWKSYNLVDSVDLSTVGAPAQKTLAGLRRPGCHGN